MLQLRNGQLHDVVVSDHNALLAEPFATAEAVGELLVATAKELNYEKLAERVIAEGRPDVTAWPARYLVGTWRDDNSMYRFVEVGVSK